tara:strand:+ start:294 stop:755 length:462 start_codon:yes stop_codon:yes gene_type:complete
MANIRIGSHPSHDYEVVEKITEAKQLTWNDSGKLFFCEQGEAYVVNLPKLSEEIAGWQAKFILSKIGSSNLDILVYGATGAGTPAGTADLDKLVFLEMTHAGLVAPASPVDGLRFPASSETSDVGTVVDIYTDGTKWYMVGVGDTAAALGTVN